MTRFTALFAAALLQASAGLAAEARVGLASLAPASPALVAAFSRSAQEAIRDGFSASPGAVALIAGLTPDADIDRRIVGALAAHWPDDGGSPAARGASIGSWAERLLRARDAGAPMVAGAVREHVSGIIAAVAAGSMEFDELSSRTQELQSLLFFGSAVSQELKPALDLARKARADRTMAGARRLAAALQQDLLAIPEEGVPAGGARLSPAAGLSRGLGRAPTTPEPSREAPRASGEALQEFIWSQRILPSVYAHLPQSNGGWRNNLRALRAFLTLGKTFDHDGDELPPSRGGFKLLHPFGSVLKIRYHGLPGHPFTGLLADLDVPGLMRLSLGAPEQGGTFIPGTAIKLFINGHDSANAVFLGEKTGVDGQEPDKNFMAQAFTNDLPKPRKLKTKIAAVVLGLFNRGNALYIPVDQFAERSADGTAAPSPKNPHRLVLKPVAGLGNASDTKRDSREEHAELPLGNIFEVYAAEGPGTELIRVGTIEATSQAVASEYGDKGLFFRHRRGPWLLWFKILASLLVGILVYGLLSWLRSR